MQTMWSPHVRHGCTVDAHLFETVTHPLFEWQSLSPSSGGGPFYDFCDALEVKNGTSAPASGWGLKSALAAWAKVSQHTLSDSQ